MTIIIERISINRTIEAIMSIICHFFKKFNRDCHRQSLHHIIIDTAFIKVTKYLIYREHSSS